ncbi:hypothetical protein BJX96DRAFT_135106 [Aspergillus floccosus]
MVFDPLDICALGVIPWIWFLSRCGFACGFWSGRLFNCDCFFPFLSTYLTYSRRGPCHVCILSRSSGCPCYTV